MQDNHKRNTGRAEILSLEKHKNLKFHTANNFSFAAQWLYVPVHYKEVARLGSSAPILFARDERGGVSPCMLLKETRKVAINAVGHWRGGQLPDVMRLYPFGWVRAAGSSRLALYPDAPHFEGEGEKLITSRGKPTQKLNKILSALVPIEQAFAETVQLMQELKTLDVAKPVNIRVGRNGQQRTATLWMVSDPSVLKLPLSSSLRTLLHAHQGSIKQLLQSVQRSEEGETTDEPEVQNATQDKTRDIANLIEQACRQFGVTIDDLRSRKRSDAIKKARVVLANNAAVCDCLDELAIQLERSVDTVKKWC